jgi:hypothetical protein
MGGMNHQPTRPKVLVGPSAWLSQKVGEGFQLVLQANSDLENAIIVSAAFLHVEHAAQFLKEPTQRYLERTQANLMSSLEKIKEIDTAYESLLSAAARENYTGNPIASKLGTYGLAQKFGGVLIRPTVNLGTWQELERRIEQSNILKTLSWEAEQFQLLVEPTKSLIEVVKTAMSKLAVDGDDAFLEAIEFNQLPLRQKYAEVFSLWNHLHALFLYSALIMTELFYRTNEIPSLVPESDIKDISASSVA